MANIYSVAYSSYGAYVSALASKKYRTAELQEIIEVKSAKLISLYCLEAMGNNTANMAIILSALETLYADTLTAPTIVFSGMESEATGAKAEAVTAGVNNISFAISMSSTSYSLFVTPYDANGDFIPYKFYNKTTGGFTIEVAADGFIDYRAILV